MADERTPTGVREGVRAGILAALRRDTELRGARTARLLLAAGAIGVAGAVGLTVLLSGHPFGHHPDWHVIALPAIWAGLLVVSLALAFLQVRTPSLPLARSASVGILGLGIAGICGAACPDPHFLEWWATTAVGGGLDRAGGLVVSALCFGLVTALVFGACAALLAAGSRGAPLRPLLPAAMLLLLLSPGVALQSVDTAWSVSAGWLAGTAAGAYTGVAAGIGLRRWPG
jgi:hypothetical protein